MFMVQLQTDCEIFPPTKPTVFVSKIYKEQSITPLPIFYWVCERSRLLFHFSWCCKRNSSQVLFTKFFYRVMITAMILQIFATNIASHHLFAWFLMHYKSNFKEEKKLSKCNLPRYHVNHDDGFDTPCKRVLPTIYTSSHYQRRSKTYTKRYFA